MQNKIHLFILIILISNLVFADQDTYPFASINQANRCYALLKDIRCVVCQFENIQESNAPLANDLRNKIYLMIKNNQSDNEIKRYLVKRYGAFILFEPDLDKATLVLWFFPLLSISIALLLLKLHFFQKKKPKI